ncbi:MAG: ferrous iron transport protein B [Christensenellaceae bacterium]|jgi:ferrous iron transport protein B|nr:ferrous iron transport protein B [Christensenellaceae bacterium]
MNSFKVKLHNVFAKKGKEKTDYITADGQTHALKIAIAGNQNSGKTTLFNALTGAVQYIGNWPGVTIEKKEGKLKSNKDVTVTDLPGIYSLSPYSPEEKVSRNYLIEEDIDAILNIVDSTNLERSLYLTTQLIEIGIPLVVCLNLTDVIKKQGHVIDTQKLSERLGVPVVCISALKGTGLKEAVDTVLAEARKKGANLFHHPDALPTDLYLQEHSGDSLFLTDELNEKVRAIEVYLKTLPIDYLHSHFFAVKLLERDGLTFDRLNLPADIKQKITALIEEIEKKYDDSGDGVVISARYTFIEALKKEVVKEAPKKVSTTEKIDRVLTHKIFALPIFIVVMFAVYYVSVTTVGTIANDFVNEGIFGSDWGLPKVISDGLTAINTADWLQSLIVDGIVAGVGAVLGFLPQMLILFFFLAILEGCGYMSRIAFILDKIFRKFGLSGKSFIPILIGTGCGVPGIMASRTVENDADRRMTIMTTTFIPCSAKLPVIALFAGAIFNNAWWVAVSVYFMGIAVILLSGLLLKKLKPFKSAQAPYITELPSYRFPSVKNVALSIWERISSFVKKAGTIILLATIFVWFTSSFGVEDGKFGMVEDAENSMLAAIGNVIKYLFYPLGFADWRSSVATVTGLIAKENIAGTLAILFNFAEEESGTWGALAASYAPLQAYSFLVFNMLCAPCFAAIGAIRREMKSAKWFWAAIGYQTLTAYFYSFVIYRIGSVFVGGLNGLDIAFTVLAFIALALYIYVIACPPDKLIWKKIDFSKR